MFGQQMLLFASFLPQLSKAILVINSSALIIPPSPTAVRLPRKAPYRAHVPQVGQGNGWVAFLHGSAMIHTSRLSLSCRNTAGSASTSWTGVCFDCDFFQGFLFLRG